MSPSSAGSRQSSEDSKLNAASRWLEQRLAPIAARFGDAPAIGALRDALPISFVGLIGGLAGFIGFAERGNLVARFRDAFSSSRLTLTLDVGFTSMAFVLVVTLSIVLARRLALPIALTLASALAVFVLSMPHPSSARVSDYARSLGASGLFLAIVVALVAAGALVLARRVAGPSRLWIGAAGTIVFAGVLFTLHLSPARALADAIEPLGTLGDTYSALLIIVLLQSLLWIVGIHGPALLAAVITPIYLRLQFANTAAYTHGTPLPHIVVVSTFLFVFPGGAGATLPVTLLLLRSRVPRLKKVAYAAIGPALINTNEPLLLGIPFVFNPYLAIPFVLAPVLLASTTYVAMALHLVAAPAFYVPSSVPTPIAVVLATLDWRAAVLIALNFALSTIVYLPFVRLLERAELQKIAGAAVPSRPA